MFTGGTKVSCVGSQSNSQAVGTLVIGVVACTDAHAVATVDGDAEADADCDARAVGVAPLPLHALIRTQDPPNIVHVTSRTWIPLPQVSTTGTDATRTKLGPSGMAAVPSDAVEACHTWVV